MNAADAKFPYHDPSLAPAARANDLVARMTLEDKAGQMFQTIVAVGPIDTPVTAFGLPSLASLAINHRISYLYVVGGADDPREFAQWVNSGQELALRSGLGIPITFSTDPRHGFVDNPAASALSSMFSLWPESIGLAALRSPETVERFADIVRQEYVSVGLRSALHPQIDVATEPRWSRAGATFGEDAELTAELAAAYVRGLQGERLGSTSVSAMAKHFPGGGPQKDGEDPHFTYGKEQVYPGGNFRYHLKPFIAAIEAGVAEIMPYYGMPVGTEYEEVGFAFNKAIITDLLRRQLGFDGVVCTDFGLLTDAVILGSDMPARAWGLESLTRQERIIRLLDAGVDQFGGEMCTEELISAVRLGRVEESRLDESVVRLLTQKFELGLFENPLADEQQAIAIAGNAEFRAEGDRAQRASMTLLTNRENEGIPTLPVTGPRRVYAENIDISDGDRLDTRRQPGGCRPRGHPRRLAVRNARHRVRGLLPRGVAGVRPGRARAPHADLRHRADRHRHHPRPGRGARRPGRPRGRHHRRLRCVRRCTARRADRSCAPRRQAAVRPAVVDGGGAEQPRGHPVRHGGAGLPVRARAQLRRGTRFHPVNCRRVGESASLRVSATRG